MEYVKDDKIKLYFDNEIVNVCGNVIVKTDKPLFMNDSTTAGYTGDFDIGKTIEGDLVIDDDNVDQYSSVSIFRVRGDLFCYNAHDENRLLYPSDIHELYVNGRKEYNGILSRFSDFDPQRLLRTLYLGIFPMYENFMINALLLFFPKNPYDIIRNIKIGDDIIDNELKKSLTDSEKEVFYRSRIRKGAFVSNGGTMNHFLRDVFRSGMKFPKDIESYYAIRNNIAHRDSITSLEKEDAISMRLICDASNRIDDFVYRLYVDMDKSYNNML